MTHGKNENNALRDSVTPVRGTSITDLEIREIWVPRDDHHIEYKPWLIYTILLNRSAQAKVAAFVEAELRRFPIEKAAHFDPSLLRESIVHYTHLATEDQNLPP